MEGDSSRVFAACEPGQFDTILCVGFFCYCDVKDAG